MSESDILVAIALKAKAWSAGLERAIYALEENRISAGRLWLALYQSQPWHRRLRIDIERWWRRR